MKDRTQFFTIIACLVAGLCVLSAARAQQSPEEQAKQILGAAGVKGGLIVHVGCGDGRLTAALRANDAYLVHGLDVSAESVAGARKHIQSLGLSGSVSVDTFDGKSLPYIDNLVSLVLCDRETAVPHTELMRVLRPLGAACIMKEGKWTRTVKPWPDEIDEWTHFLHGPDGNPVARDSGVKLPFHMQWVGDPGHSKTHSHLSSVNVVVSSMGRIFYIADEGLTALPSSLPSRWALFARDGFNGVTLWRRPISSWQPSDLSGRNFFPVDLYRRVVADGDKVYATLSIFGPVAALDAATGTTIKTYEGTESTEEIICREGILYLVVGTAAADKIDRRQLAIRRMQAEQKIIVAVKADSGKALWEKRDGETMGVMPMTLAASAGRVFFQNTQNIICLDSQSGQEMWRCAKPSLYSRPSWSAPTLVVYEDYVLLADRWAKEQRNPNEKAAGSTMAGELVVVSAKTGERLWAAPAAEGCSSPIDAFVVDGLVWVGEETGRKDPDYRKARDIRTGQVVRSYLSSDD